MNQKGVSLKQHNPEPVSKKVKGREEEEHFKQRTGCIGGRGCHEKVWH